MLLAVISLVLLLGGLAIGVALGGMMPLPYGADSAIQAYVRAEPVAVQAIAVGVFASSVPLAIYAATASARLRQLGVTAPGATIALAGGVLAAGALGLSGLVAWTLSRPEVSTDDSLVRALYYLVFLTGGPAHVVTLGLLVAGMAVPSLILGLLPRPLAVAGLVIAVLAELTTLVLVWPVLGFLLPIARLGALIWLVVAGALLPLRRQNMHATRAGWPDMKLSVSVTNYSWPAREIGSRLAQLAGFLDGTAVDTLWVADHLLQADPSSRPDEPMLEAYTVLGCPAAGRGSVSASATTPTRRPRWACPARDRRTVLAADRVAHGGLPHVGPATTARSTATTCGWSTRSLARVPSHHRGRPC